MQCEACGSSTPWGGYLRISEDPHDKRSGVTRQREDVASAVVRQGGCAECIVWFEENDTSAFKKRRIKVADPMGNEYIGFRVIRPVWHEALHAAREQRIEALMVWDLDRLARDQRDLADAVEVVQHYGRRVESAGKGSIDLSTDGGVAMAQVLMAMAIKSSADTSRRVAREHLAAARKGEPRGGVRPFGYLDDKATPHEEEAAAIRWMAERTIDGIPLRSIAAELTEQGMKSTMGNDLVARTVRAILINPRYAGWRVDKHKKIVRGKDGDPVRGQWEPILDQETFDRVNAILNDPRRLSRSTRPGKRKYLLSGLLRCGICNAVLYGRTDERRGVSYYACTSTRGERHGLSVSGSSVDRIVRVQVGLKLLEAPSEPEEQVEWGKSGRIEEIDTMIAEAMARLRTSPSLQRVIYDHLEELELERGDLEREKAQWLLQTTGPKRESMTAEEWQSFSTEEMRPYMSSVLSSVTIMPPVKKGPKFDPSRLSYNWK